MKLLENHRILAGIGILTTADIKRYLGLSDSALRKLIWRYQKHGVLVKLRNGLYTVKCEGEPGSFLLANKLYQPSYLSFETALSYYSVIPETVYTIVSATTRITRTFNSLGRDFSYRKIKKQAYGGYRVIKTGGAAVLIAEPEKALADQLYFIFLRKAGMFDRINMKKLRRSLVWKYIRQFQNDKFIKWSKSAF